MTPPRLPLWTLMASVGLTPIVSAQDEAPDPLPRDRCPIEVVWVASEPTDSCEGPTQGEVAWRDSEFDDSAWTVIEMPDVNTIPRPGHRFYRGHFVVVSGAVCNLTWASDDGSWIYLNGTPLGHWGGDCGEPGCVGGARGCGGPGGFLDLTPHLREGVNVLGVHVGNASCCCGSLLDATVTTDALTSLAVEQITEPGAPPTAPRLVTAMEVTVTAPSSDPEGQRVYYLYHWTSDGGDEVVHGPFLRTSDTLTETELVDPGERWTVTVIPTDGVNVGPATTASFRAPQPSRAASGPSAASLADLLDGAVP